VGGIGLSPTIFLLPLVFVPLVLLTMGCTWFLASVGVYLRDTGPTVAILTTILLFLSPIFFPSTAVPPEFRFLIRLNPLTFVVEQARAVLTFRSLPDFLWLSVVTLQNLLVAALGLWWFQKTRRGFGDVI
jgi:homopolymeric O-antigen transport system permease protein